MKSTAAPKGYTGMQIALHWLIAALVIFQLFFGDEIQPALRAYRHGAQPTAAASFDAHVHVYIGISVLVLALWRVLIRLRHGVPMLPRDENPALRAIAIATHVILYLVIFVMPVTGMMRWYAGIHAAGEVHVWIKPVIIIFVGLHALAALWQHFVARTDVLVRMLKPERKSG